MGHLLAGSTIGLIMTSTKKDYATCCVAQVCFTQSPYPWSRPLLTCTSTGDTQTLKGRSGSVSVVSLGPGVHKVLFESSNHLWWVWGMIINASFLLLPSCCGFSFTLGHGVSYFGEIQYSPVNWCSAASCNFGVLTGEDEHMSFYSTILIQNTDKSIANIIPKGENLKTSFPLR